MAVSRESGPGREVSERTFYSQLRVMESREYYSILRILIYVKCPLLLTVDYKSRDVKRC
jgi:hypothetical protein